MRNGCRNVLLILFALAVHPDPRCDWPARRRADHSAASAPRPWARCSAVNALAPLGSKSTGLAPQFHPDEVGALRSPHCRSTLQTNRKIPDQTAPNREGRSCEKTRKSQSLPLLEQIASIPLPLSRGSLRNSSGGTKASVLRQYPPAKEDELMVRAAGFEPARPIRPRHFKCHVSTIPPRPHLVNPEGEAGIAAGRQVQVELDNKLWKNSKAKALKLVRNFNQPPAPTGSSFL